MLRPNLAKGVVIRLPPGVLPTPAGEALPGKVLPRISMQKREPVAQQVLPFGSEKRQGYAQERHVTTHVCARSRFRRRRLTGMPAVASRHLPAFRQATYNLPDERSWFSARLVDELRDSLLSAAFNMISQLTCPTCGHRVIPEETPSMPFCSVRCKHIDLGRWFNQEIGLPVEPDENRDNEDASHS